MWRIVNGNDITKLGILVHFIHDNRQTHLIQWLEQRRTVNQPFFLMRSSWWMDHGSGVKLSTWQKQSPIKEISLSITIRSNHHIRVNDSASI